MKTGFASAFAALGLSLAIFSPAGAQQQSKATANVGAVAIIAPCPSGQIQCIHPQAVSAFLQALINSSCFTDQPGDCVLANGTVTGAMLAPSAAAANLFVNSSPSSPPDGSVWVTPSGVFYRTAGATLGLPSGALMSVIASQFGAM